MKILTLVLFVSLTAQARQYIQCSSSNIYSFDGLVINLNEDQSTLFMTNGVHLPDEDRVDLLMNLNLSSQNQNNYLFKVEDDSILEIPASVIGQYSNSFSVYLIQDSYSQQYYCFSAIYND